MIDELYNEAGEVIRSPQALTLAAANPAPTAFVVPGMFTIRRGGVVEVEQGVDLDDASRAFWAAVERMAPGLTAVPESDKA